jgi:hypothetical protein
VRHRTAPNLQGATVATAHALGGHVECGNIFASIVPRHLIIGLTLYQAWKDYSRVSGKSASRSHTSSWCCPTRSSRGSGVLSAIPTSSRVICSTVAIRRRPARRGPLADRPFIAFSVKPWLCLLKLFRETAFTLPVSEASAAGELVTSIRAMPVC